MCIIVLYLIWNLKENNLNTSYASNTLNIWVRIPFILFKSGQFIKNEKLHKLLYKPLLKRKKMYHKMAQVCGIWVTISYSNLFFFTTYIYMYVWQTYLLSLVKWLTKFPCVVCLFFFIDFEQEIYQRKEENIHLTHYFIFGFPLNNFCVHLVETVCVN